MIWLRELYADSRDGVVMPAIVLSAHIVLTGEQTSRRGPPRMVELGFVLLGIGFSFAVAQLFVVGGRQPSL
jgi:hypothetical protein